MKIGLFTDSHYSSMEVSCRTRRPSLSYGKIREAMEHFRGVDMVICLGDLIDHCEKPADNKRHLSEIAEMIRSYGIPFYSLMGNHDCDVFTPEEFDALGGGRPPFSICDGKTALIFLDANYTLDGLHYAVGKVDWTQCLIPQDQMERLSMVLDDPQTERAYVFVHQNLDPDVQYQHIISNAGEIRRMLKQSGKTVKVIQGHYHPGHQNEIDGIEYRTLPAMCEGEGNHFEILEI